MGKIFGQLRVHVGNLRDITQGVFQLQTQILYVLPLLLRQTLTPQVDVFSSQLLLIKQPLNDKQRSYRGKKELNLK